MLDDIDGYALLAEYVVRPGVKQSTPVAAGELRCRYCRRSEADGGRFTREAHALSECVGNRDLLSRDECDDCNHFFGWRLEDHLGRWLLPLRAITRMRGKSGYPSSGRIGPCEIRSVAGRVQVTPHDDDGLVIDEVARTLTVVATRQPYIPVRVFKSLVKMAMAISPVEGLHRWDAVADWIRENGRDSRNPPFAVPLLVYATHYPGPGIRTVVARLWRRTDDRIGRPDMLFWLRFGNVSLQIPVPGLGTFGTTQDLDYVFAAAEDEGMAGDAYGEPRGEPVDLSSSSEKREDRTSTTMRYKRLVTYDLGLSPYDPTA